MKHHTKDKGDVGVGFVIADLLTAGIQPAILLSEHLPFDCIAVAPDGRMSRLSVKYRTAKLGSITVRLTNSWADKNGTHSKKHDKQTFDAVAVYCPQTERVYYIRVGEFDGNVDAFTLRLEPSKNNQTARVRLAHDFLGAVRLFR